MLNSNRPLSSGRGDATRTRNTWFWRPLLYQLNYSPILPALASTDSIISKFAPLVNTKSGNFCDFCAAAPISWRLRAAPEHTHQRRSLQQYAMAQCAVSICATDAIIHNSATPACLSLPRRIRYKKLLSQTVHPRRHPIRPELKHTASRRTPGCRTRIEQ